MRLWRSLSRRVLAVSILCGLVGLTTASLVIRFSNREMLGRAFGPLALHAYQEYELRRCEASPATWMMEPGPGGRYFAYDAATLRSHNPAAPPLDLALLRELRPGSESPIMLETFGPFRGRKLVFRGADAGPCAVVQGFAVAPAPRAERLAAILAGAVAAFFLAAALGFAAIFRPLALRIERLRRSAERVGDAAGYAPAEQGSGDELAQVGTSLDRAHGRIRADALRLEQRQVELERRLADVMHDLRTPLASLHLSLEQAADACADPAVARLVGGALGDAVYLAGLVSNLRVASQLREGWDLLAGDPRVNLGEVVERVFRRARSFARRRGLSLDIAIPDGPVRVRCHPTAAEQAVSNIVENAVAYGDPGGHVAVLLEQEGPDGFSLIVRDDGPGVAPAELPRLGERMFRSDEARQRDPRGSGLGLAITTEVCARCGWEIAFAAEAPRGLRVTLRGPTAPG